MVMVDGGSQGVREKKERGRGGGREGWRHGWGGGTGTSG
jgi:hypothetical protein